jgi:hypothetical protein
MNNNTEDFLLYAKNHRISVVPWGSRTQYCSGSDCTKCVLNNKCNHLNNVGTLNKKELGEMQDKYPEYFI